MSDKRLEKLPTLFRGIMWDAGWEFDAPCVLYAPFERYGFGGNAGHLESMVEDICIDLSLGGPVRRGFAPDELKEFRWRGWSPTGFRRRKNAWHVAVAVRWKNLRSELAFEIAGHREQWGPFK